MRIVTIVIWICTLSGVLFHCASCIENVEAILKELVEKEHDSMIQKSQLPREFEASQHPENQQKHSYFKPGTEADNPQDDSEIAALWAAIGKLTSALKENEEKDEAQQEEIDQVKEDVDEIETKYQQIKVTTDTLQTKTSGHETKLDKIDKGAVGFFAYVAGGTYFYKGEALIFHVNEYNVGNHYDKTTGKFTCPYHGVYQFNAVVVGDASRDDDVAAEFVIDGMSSCRFMIEMRNREGDQHWFKTTSASCVIECKAGQRVWLKALTYVYMLWTDYDLPTFSGALINRLDL